MNRLSYVKPRADAGLPEEAQPAAVTYSKRKAGLPAGPSNFV